MDNTAILQEQAKRYPHIGVAMRYFHRTPRVTPSDKEAIHRTAAKLVTETAESARLRQRLGPGIVDILNRCALVENVADGMSDAQSLAPTPLVSDPNWTTEGSGCFSCERRGKIYVNTDGGWRHHAITGQLQKTGRGQQQLTEYLKALKINDPGTVQAAAEAARDRFAAIVHGALPRDTRNLHEAHAIVTRAASGSVLTEAQRTAVDRILERALGGAR
jgi:hypothetical protein